MSKRVDVWLKMTQRRKGNTQLHSDNCCHISSLASNTHPTRGRRRKTKGPPVTILRPALPDAVTRHGLDATSGDLAEENAHEASDKDPRPIPQEAMLRKHGLHMCVSNTWELAQ